MVKKGLGRGLGAIFGNETAVNEETPTEYKSNKSRNRASSVSKDKNENDSNDKNVSRETLALKISLIEPNPQQPRKNFDEGSLNELADSIRQHGVLQPILVKKKGRMYEIVVGERRWRAARLAGLTEIPAVVGNMDDRESAEAALIENIQRQDLGSVEEARAYKALIDEYGLTQDELAGRLSRSRTAITNSLRLLQLDDEILGLIDDGILTAGHARAVLAVNGKRNRLKAAKEIASEGLSVREAEKLAKAYNIEAEREARKAEKNLRTGQTGENSQEDDTERLRSAYIKALETEFTNSMNTKVSIKHTGREKGRIEIEFYSDDELNSIAERLGINIG